MVERVWGRRKHLAFVVEVAALSPAGQRPLLGQRHLNFRRPASSGIDPIYPGQRLELMAQIGKIRGQKARRDAGCQPRLDRLDINMLNVAHDRQPLYLLGTEMGAPLVEPGAHQTHARH